jgi:hypothetical protein
VSPHGAGSRAGHGGAIKKRIALYYSMVVKTPIENTEGMYFITFTCQDWLSLFEITKSYDTVYKWFGHLKTKGHVYKGLCNHAQSFTCYN